MGGTALDDREYQDFWQLQKAGRLAGERESAIRCNGKGQSAKPFFSVR
jgi:hypothetical protein